MSKCTHKKINEYCIHNSDSYVIMHLSVLEVTPRVVDIKGFQLIKWYRFSYSEVSFLLMMFVKSITIYKDKHK